MLSDEGVDAFVDQLFLAEDARKENNLQYVGSSIEAIPDRRPLMKLYERVYRGEAVPENKSSPLQERLRLIGLVRVEDGLLKVRNEIYRCVFDAGWIKENTPRSVSKSVIVGAVTIIIVAIVALAALLLYQEQAANQTRIAQYTNDFETVDTNVRMNALAQLCAVVLSLRDRATPTKIPPPLAGEKVGRGEVLR